MTCGIMRRENRHWGDSYMLNCHTRIVFGVSSDFTLIYSNTQEMGGTPFNAKKLRCQEVSLSHQRIPAMCLQWVLMVCILWGAVLWEVWMFSSTSCPRAGLSNRKGISSGAGLIPNLWACVQILWGLIRVFLTVLTT